MVDGVARLLLDVVGRTRSRSPCVRPAALFIDIDDLKTTNDTLGHEAGDDLLNAAAARLRQAVGPADVVGRHGGDEFRASHLRGLQPRRARRSGQPATGAACGAGRHRRRVGADPCERGNRRDRPRRQRRRLRDADWAMYKAKSGPDAGKAADAQTHPDFAR
jgi:predicted signal transduction protein with EAL and GGDEF domain